VLDAALGAQLLAACDAVAGGTGPAADERGAWVRSQLVEPLVVRLDRAGYPATATDALVAWIAEHLPADGTPPQRWLDREVTARLLATLPASPGPVSLDAGPDGPVLGPARA
jgi:hypothetical protein